MDFGTKGWRSKSLNTVTCALPRVDVLVMVDEMSSETFDVIGVVIYQSDAH